MCKLARTITTASTASDVGTGGREDGGGGRASKRRAPLLLYATKEDDCTLLVVFSSASNWAAWKSITRVITNVHIIIHIQKYVATHAHGRRGYYWLKFQTRSLPSKFVKYCASLIFDTYNTYYMWMALRISKKKLENDLFYYMILRKISFTKSCRVLERRVLLKKLTLKVSNVSWRSVPWIHKRNGWMFSYLLGKMHGVNNWCIYASKVSK